jgi:isocitrate/isopropylmalate dehydrogenase
MLEYLQENEKAQLIETAVTKVLQEGTTRTFDIGGNSTTSEMGDAIAQKVRSINK